MAATKKMHALNLLWISFTSMIGSGWLFGSLYSAHFAGPAAVIAWPLAAFFLLFVALAYAEVATMFPQKDILARLPLYTHGRLTSVIMSGLAWISLATIPVIETQGLIQYANNYWPNLVVRHGLHYSITFSGYLFALTLLFSFVLLNYFGVRLFARINTGFTIWKILIPGITIISLAAFSFQGSNFFQYGGFMPYGWQGVMSAISSGGVLFSLLGFRQVVVLASEIEHPEKYIPIILVSSLVLTGLLYTALQWSFIGSMRAQDLVHGWANLSFPGDAGPFAALALLAGLMWLSLLLYADAFISPYSTALVYSTTASYMLASMASMGDAPKHCALKNKYESAYVSLIVNFILAAAMFFLLHGWQAMSSFLVDAMMISYAVGPVSLICLRKQLPDLKRPFRLRCSGLISFIGFYVCTAGVYWAGLSSIVKLLALVLLGLGFYLMHYFLFKKLRHVLDVRNALWLLCYMIGLSVFSYYGNYGGIRLIPSYWDLIYLLVFALVIFYLAIYSRSDQDVMKRDQP
jgi:amino acid transporter